MAVRERGAGWQADVTWQGRRIREQFDTRAEAERWAASAEDALKKGKPLPARTATGDGRYATIKTLVEAVITLEWSRTEGCKNSVRNARKFADFVGPDLPPREALAPGHIEDYVADLIDRERSGSTINRHLSAISVMGKYALRHAKIDRPLELPWQKEGQARLRWFTDQEEAALLQTLHLWGYGVQRDFLIFLLDTGARPWTEAFRLRWENVAERPRSVSFECTKNGEDRGVPLTTRAWEAIERQRGNGLQGPWRAVNKNQFHTMWKRLRVHLPWLEDAVLYTARHTFASRLVQRGVPIDRVQKLMGHKVIAMTLRYAKLAPTDLFDAVAVLEGRAFRPGLALVGEADKHCDAGRDAAVTV